ncbi:MAG: LuxR C-terminal-related transcriptional regulator [Pseudomonas sp.]
MSPSSPAASRPAELPRLAPGHLPRPRLRDALLQADCRLRLLCAPAGSGKSTMLSECAQQCPADTSLVYLDLRGKALSGEALFNKLAVGLGTASADLEGLIQQLEHSPGPVWLLLDDYPRFADSALDHALNDLILSAPRRVCWWIASRRRPALQLSRLLMDGELFELGAGELSFSVGELGELLQHKALHWPWPAIEQLHEDSQGWCAALRLHMLSLTPGQAPLALDRGDPRLLDYLQREALDELPDGWSQALFSLAQLPHFTAALCEQLLGVGEGAQLLEQLSECGLFIEPSGTDGQLSRVQPVVAPALASQLPATLAKAVFRKACQWYVSQDNVRQALECAVKAGQSEVAVNLMQRYSEDFLLQGRSLAQLMAWRRELPLELLTSTPRLLLLNAWALLFSGRLDEAQHYTEQLARFAPQPTASRQRELIAQWKALHANLAFHRGNAAQAGELLTEAVAELPERSWSQRLFCCALQVEQALINGRLDVALALNRSATKQAREHASLAMESVMALGHVKLLEIRGELLRAETLLKRLYNELSTAWGAEASPMRGRVQLRRAALLLQQGRYPEATSAYQSGQQENLACGDPAAFWSYLGLAELDALQGDLSSAFQRIADAERFMQYNHIDEALYQGLLLRAKARLWLIQGRVAQADKALQAMPHALLEVSPYGAPELNLRLQLLQLQARLANGVVDEALSGLAELHAKALGEGRRPLACEIGFSLAEALYADNKPAQAKQALLDALALARQMNLASAERAFAQRSPALMRWAGEASRNDGVPAALLSRRELDVLKLIVRGYSNQQIAESLFISLHTVKTHAQRINFKLGVERRTQAVARAKELGLG